MPRFSSGGHGVSHAKAQRCELGCRALLCTGEDIRTGAHGACARDSITLSANARSAHMERMPTNCMSSPYWCRVCPHRVSGKSGQAHLCSHFTIQYARFQVSPCPRLAHHPCLANTPEHSHPFGWPLGLVDKVKQGSFTSQTHLLHNGFCLEWLTKVTD